MLVFTLSRAGAGPQMLGEIQCFSGLPTHSCPFLLQDCCSLHHPRGDFYQRVISSKPRRLSKAVLSRSRLKLPEPAGYLAATGICLARPTFACVCHGRPPSLQGKGWCAQWVSARGRSGNLSVHQDCHLANLRALFFFFTYWLNSPNPFSSNCQGGKVVVASL